MFDDRLGDHVALGIGQWSPALADLERVLSDSPAPIGHAPLKNGTGTEVNPSSPFGQGAGVRWRGGAWGKPTESGTRGGPPHGEAYHDHSNQNPE